MLGRNHRRTGERARALAGRAGAPRRAPDALLEELEQRTLLTTFYMTFRDDAQYHDDTVSEVAGTHKFQIDKIEWYRTTEWFVNGAYVETDESGVLANDPELAWTFSTTSKTTTIQGNVYDGSKRLFQNMSIGR